MKQQQPRAAMIALVLLLAFVFTWVAAPQISHAATEVPTSVTSLSAALTYGNSLTLAPGHPGLTCDQNFTSSGYQLDLNGSTLTISGAKVITASVSGGTIAVPSGAKLYLGSGVTASVSGSGTVRVEGPAIAGASSVYYSDGSTESADYTGGSGCLWIPSGATVAMVVIDHVFYTVSGNTATKLTIAITYLYNDAQRSAMTLNAAKYPATLSVMDTDQTIPAAPDQEGYAFANWSCDSLPSGNGKTFTVKAGTSSDLVLVSNWTVSSGNAAAGAMSGSQGGGSRSSTAASSVLAASSDEDDDTDTTDTASNVMSGYGVRIRTASATTKHSITSSQSMDVEAMASQKRKQSFPWQWIGISAAALVILTACGYLLKKYNDEKTAALYEKLNIKD